VTLQIEHIAVIGVGYMGGGTHKCSPWPTSSGRACWSRARPTGADESSRGRSVDGADLVEAQVQMSAGILISRVDTAGGRCLIAFLMERRCRLHDRWHLRHHGGLQIS
jgi:hypothetical protein